MNTFDLPRRRYAYDGIARWPDEARRELDDGTPILLYAPGFCPDLVHSHCLGTLLFTLQNWIQTRNSGEVTLLVDWQIDEWNSVAPDLCYFRDTPKVRADDQCLIAAPDLTIEVLDERTRDNDTRRKPALYAAQNVPLFWMFDPQTQTVFMNENPTANGYSTRTELTLDDVLTHASLPGFQLPLSQIFD